MEMLTPDDTGKRVILVGEETEKKVKERRRWEDLEADCLANVFNKVGLESLLLSVPFVCKSWYSATLNPISWQCLNFPAFQPYPLFTDNFVDRTEPPKSFGPFYDKFIEQYGINKRQFSITAFVNLVVDRSKGTALVLKLPQFCTEQALRYVSDNCPLLRDLWLTDDLVLFKLPNVVLEVIGKWKYLKRLTLGFETVRYIMKRFITESCKFGTYVSKHFEELLISEIKPPNSLNYDVLNRILVQLSTHCKRLKHLYIYCASLGEVETSTIVNLLPKLKSFGAGMCRVERDSVVTLLQGCKELEMVYFVNCDGFEQGDQEIVKLASNITYADCVGHHQTDIYPFDPINKFRNLISLKLELSRTMVQFNQR